MNAVVVVGAGLAGVRTAAELRTRGYGGDLTLLTAEDAPRTTGRRCRSTSSATPPTWSSWTPAGWSGWTCGAG